MREHDIETPFGKPSGKIAELSSGRHRIYFVPRHGAGHVLTPSEVPYAANVHALKSLGVTHIISISAVGGLQEQFGPGAIVLPDQFIDRTTRRQNTFFGSGIVGHVGMAEPTCASWRNSIYAAAKRIDANAHNGATYICIEGPQFSTRAESNLYRQWGCDVIGMTNATEAKLVREAGLCYASLCFVTDYDCWKTDEEPVTVNQILAVMRQNVDKGKAIVSALIQNLDDLPTCERSDPRQAVVTDPAHQSHHQRRQLAGILEPAP